MNRRHFLKASSLAAATPAISNISLAEKAEVIKPKALRKGDKVGLVTPASALTRTAFEKAVKNLKDLGYEITYSDNLRVRRGFLSGTDEQRADDIHKMFEDPSVKGIFCARGGYGSARILPLLDYDLIRNNPKVFIGYSDITAMHQAIYAKTGLITFHGPVGASTFNDFTTDYLNDATQKGKKFKIKPESEVLVPGEAKGRLIGGNLSLLASLIGTPYQTSYKDHILFIEEIGESVYRIDRMLTQIGQSGVLEGVKGIILGYFTDCDTDPEDEDFETSIGLSEVFEDQFAKYNVPVIQGFPFGHEEHNATLAVGIQASLDTRTGRLKMEESAVS